MFGKQIPRAVRDEIQFSLKRTEADYRANARGLTLSARRTAFNKLTYYFDPTCTPRMNSRQK
jgi:hypothetical protein